MNSGPLNEEELEWLDEALMNHGSENSVLDISELDGMFTAILSGPTKLPSSVWLTALWGGEQQIPLWPSDVDENRFNDLIFQHLNDTAERLATAPDQFEPLFGFSTIDDEDYEVVEDWCFGYLRGVALDDWSGLPDSLQPALDAIAVHGDEEQFAKLEKMTPDEYVLAQQAIRPAALKLYAYWTAKRAPE